MSLKSKIKQIKGKANLDGLFKKLEQTDFKEKIKSSLVKLKEILKQESKETKEMFETYQRYTRGEATEKEMEEANNQFRDLIKGLGLGFIIVLPFSPVTIPLVVKLGQRLGVDVFPSAVKEQMSKDKKSVSYTHLTLPTIYSV